MDTPLSPLSTASALLATLQGFAARAPVALRATADLGTLADRHCLQSILALHERAIDACRRETAAVNQRAERAFREAYEAREELRLARLTIERLRRGEAV